MVLRAPEGFSASEGGMRYFFHVIGMCMTLLDDEGDRFSCTEHAIQEAAQVAGELRGDSE